LRQALRWNAWRTDPVRQLPGGQSLPIVDISLFRNGPSQQATRHG